MCKVFRLYAVKIVDNGKFVFLLIVDFSNRIIVLMYFIIRFLALRI